MNGRNFGYLQTNLLQRFWHSLRPAQMFAGSFLLLILLGTVGFMVIPGLYTGPGLSWIDAFFTSTSAVCVTGLIVVDTATHFTLAGQIWILLLIQLGGLGMITLASLIIVALDQRLSLRTHVLATGVEVFGASITPRELIRRVVLFTFTIEGLGALFLWIWWSAHGNPIASFWKALFHSISAFCNAGFSTHSDSLVRFQQDPISLSILSGLIILGGIGFVVMSDLRQWWQTQGLANRHVLSFHTRITVATTIILLIGGWVLFGIFEWNVTLQHLPFGHRLSNSFFLSITSRTAGFNTIDYANASDSTNFLTILLMSIGGSPGSTAGGLKTTTIAVIAIVAWSRLRGRTHASISGRTIPEQRVQGAVGLFTLAFAIVTAGIFAYTSLEIPYVSHSASERGFLPYMFEAVSAFNTVGLTMGPTPTLGISGKVITIILMFIGRVGPLGLVAAFAAKSQSDIARIRYPQEDVMIG